MQKTFARSFTYTAPTVTNYTVGTAQTGVAIAWGSEVVCGSTFATGVYCGGLAEPWGFGTITDYVAAVTSTGAAAVPGYVRAYHYLGDAPSDRSKIFSLATGDALTALVAYTVDYSTSGVTAGNAATVPVYTWRAGTLTVAGATSTILGFASLIGVVSSMF